MQSPLCSRASPSLYHRAQAPVSVCVIQFNPGSCFSRGSVDEGVVSGPTVNVAMLQIQHYPVTPALCKTCGKAGPWQHLPDPQARLFSRFKNLASSIFQLHA